MQLTSNRNTSSTTFRPTTRWLPIPNEPNYLLSEYGEVLSLINNRILTPHIVDGYRRIKLSNRRWHRINRLVCLTFHGPPPKDGKHYDAAHLDGDRSHDAAYNLAWATRSENMLHARQHGTLHRTLSDDDVIEIRRLRLAGLTFAQIADYYQIAGETARNVATLRSHIAVQSPYDAQLRARRVDYSIRFRGAYVGSVNADRDDDRAALSAATQFARRVISPTARVERVGNEFVVTI